MRRKHGRLHPLSTAWNRALTNSVIGSRCTRLAEVQDAQEIRALSCHFIWIGLTGCHRHRSFLMTARSTSLTCGG